MEAEATRSVVTQAAHDRWNVFDETTPVLTYSYSFGPGTANALAVGIDGGLMVVSPPCRVAENVFHDLGARGTVRALVASNAFHHLGIPEWKRRYPEALIFAPAQSIGRVERQTKLHGVRPVSEAAALAGPVVELVDMPHYRTGEVLVRVRTAHGRVWYVTDVILNMPELPTHPIVGRLFRWTGSAPGLKYNNVGAVFMVKDRKALRRWLAAEYEKAPPRWLIPTHGDIVDFEADPGAARTLFAVS